MAFAVGSKVVYPSHGVAQIVRREKRVVDGEKRDYLILEVPQQGWGTSGAMTVSVPEANAEISACVPPSRGPMPPRCSTSSPSAMCGAGELVAPIQEPPREAQVGRCVPVR